MHEAAIIIKAIARIKTLARGKRKAADWYMNVGKKAYTNPKTQQTLRREFRRRNLCPLERRKKSLNLRKRNLKKRNLRRKRSRTLAFT